MAAIPDLGMHLHGAFQGDLVGPLTHSVEHPGTEIAIHWGSAWVRVVGPGEKETDLLSPDREPCIFILHGAPQIM